MVFLRTVCNRCARITILTILKHSYEAINSEGAKHPRGIRTRCTKEQLPHVRLYLIWIMPQKLTTISSVSVIFFSRHPGDEPHQIWIAGQLFYPVRGIPQGRVASLLCFILQCYMFCISKALLKFTLLIS